jgi:hypothetical protein
MTAHSEEPKETPALLNFAEMDVVEKTGKT